MLPLRSPETSFHSTLPTTYADTNTVVCQKNTHWHSRTIDKTLSDIPVWAERSFLVKYTAFHFTFPFLNHLSITAFHFSFPFPLPGWGCILVFKPNHLQCQPQRCSHAGKCSGVLAQRAGNTGRQSQKPSEADVGACS